jgi:hypothetical protein
MHFATIVRVMDDLVGGVLSGRFDFPTCEPPKTASRLEGFHGLCGLVWPFGFLVILGFDRNDGEIRRLGFLDQR